MSRLLVTIDGHSYEVEVTLRLNGGPQVCILLDGKNVPVVLPELQYLPGEAEWFIVDGRPYEVQIDSDLHWIRSRWGMHALEVHDLETTLTRPHTGDGRIKAPIPGQITQVMVAVGSQVQTGQPMLILEAMKMENEIRAPCSGVVKALNVSPGQRVALHEVLAEIA
jgi:acetyl/propionyl-CoA carboxylase alpha subunit